MDRRATDQKVMGIKKEHFNKGTIITALVGVLVFLQDDIKEFIFNTNSTTTVGLVKEAMAENNKLLIEPITSSLEKNLATAINAHGKTKLTDQQAIYIMKTAVGYQSIHKTDWLRKYLQGYKQEDIQKNRGRIAHAIEAEFVRQSEIYISSLNGFVHPKLGLLGNFVADHFPMKEFLDAVVIISADPICTEIPNKINDVMYLMLSMQNDMWNKARVEVGEL